MLAFPLGLAVGSSNLWWIFRPGDPPWWVPEIPLALLGVLGVLAIVAHYRWPHARTPTLVAVAAALLSTALCATLYALGAVMEALAWV